QDPNEIGVEGVELTLTGAGDDGVFGTGDDVTATTTTDENGYYLFDNLEPGAYMTEVTDDAGATYEVLNTTDYDQTGDPDEFGEPATDPDNKLTDAVVLGPGDVFLNADYGYQPTDANDSVSAIGDYVWFDADKDGSGPSAESPDEGGGAITQGAGGTADPSEYGIEGVSVALIRDENANGIWDDGEPIIATDVTDENGFYYFPDLIEDDGTGTDDYLVWVNDTDNVLDDLKPTFDKDGGDVPFETGAPLGEDADNVLGISAVTNLGTAAAPGAFRLMQDFGYTPRTNSVGDGLIGDYVWFDDNRDGVQDPDEEGIEGVVVELYDLGADDMVGGGDDVLIATATTNENGYYYFDGLPLDDDEGDNDFAYQVIIADENFDPGKPLQGFENTADPDSGTTNPDNEGGAVVLNGGNTQDLDQDFGYAGQNGSTPVGSIGDTVFEDRDADGVRDAGEEGIPGVTIDLYRDLNGNGELDPGEPKIGTETTDANGMYLFTDLPIDDGGGDDDADYIVDVTDVNGVLIGYWHSTSPNQDASTNVGDDDVSMDDTGDNSKEDAFAVSLNAMIPNNRNVDFGYYKDLAALGNYVWIDVNENGLQDDGETGINDVEVTLTIEYPNDDIVTVVVTTEDDANGNPGFYDFPNLLADEDYNMGTFGDPSSDGLPLFTISVDEDQPEFTDNNFVPTIDDVNANTDDLADSDDFAGVVAKPVQGSEDTSAKDPSTTEEEIASYDFGVKESLPGAIGNYVWLDENSDGFQDIGEPGIPNVQVNLKDENGVVISTTYTDANGGYLFPDLAEGTYFVDVVENTLPDGVTQTTVFTNSADDKPFDDIDDGDFGNKDQSVSFGYQVDLDSGEENMTADFGYNYNPTDDVDNGEDTAALGDRVWIDSDGDGMQDPEEIGVSGVEVTLTGAGPDGEFGTGDDITDMTTTDDNGFYLFDNLAPGAYMVEVTDDDGASHDVLEDSDYAQTGDPDDFGMPAMNPDDKTTTPVILAPGDVFLNADFGYQPNNNAPLGSIGNTVWLDADADGNGPSDVNGDSSNGAGVEDDDNEEPIPAVSVALVKDTNGNGEWDAGEPIIATDVTDENGQYLFEDLPVTNGAGSDDYIVVITDTDNVLSDLKATYDKDGGADQTGSLAPVSGTPTDPADVLGVTAVSNLTTTPVTDADFGYTPEGQDDGEGLIGDFVWFDNDGDGNQDPDEPGIEGVIVELFDPGADMMPGGGDDVLLFTTTTDENGNYYFGGLDADNDKYYVKVADENFDPNGVLEGMENTEDPDSDDDNEGATVTLTNADPVDLDQDFGYRAPMNADGSIGNFVWEDLNADGNVDAGEMGIDGITLDLYRDLNSNGVVDPGEPLFSTTTTANGGAYLFENLPFGDYIVDVTDEAGLLNGYWHSLGDQAELGTDNESKVDPYGADGGITISSIARDYLLADFGYYVRPAALGNFVWEDLNGDGIQDANEPGINGVEVTLTIMYPDGVTTTTVKTTTSTINGKDGSYNFGNLLLDEDYNTGTNGNPTVDDLPKFTISVDEAQTAIDNLNLVPTLIDVMTGGATDLNDSDDPAGVIGIPTQGQENTTPLANPTLEEVIASYDFGFAKFVSLGSTVFLDQNNNGFQDDVDNGIQGVDVFLFRDTNENGVIDGMEGDTPFRMTTTDANGNYFFGRLREGKYQVVIPADNFQPGGALNAFSVSSSGAATTDNEDRDDNGDQAFIGAETVSQVVMLMAGMEPVSGNGPMDESNAFGGGQDGPDGTPRDKSGNMTIDFGFQSIPLPVELIAFKATPDVDHIDLTWITASEIDNDYFDLERSEDGKSFKAITQLDGQGTTLEQVTYAYEDATVQPNVLYYYRLKQVDFDGTSEYSEIVTAQINGEKEGGMELYPNPVGVGSTLNVRFFTEEFTAELYIMDIQGRIIRTIKRDIVNTGWNIIEIEVADLAAGTYLIADRSGEIREFVKTE
ncbi:MAG: SdrD B-like domain-containing protein, partial [Bacteroidota bacterium]